MATLHLQKFDYLRKSPTAARTFAITLKKEGEALYHVPLNVVGQHTEKYLGADAIIGFVLNGTHFKLDGFQVPKSANPETNRNGSKNEPLPLRT